MKINPPTQIPAYAGLVRYAEVIDGDSVRVTRELGFYHYDNQICRLNGIDTPEKSTQAGKLVAAVVEQWIKDHPRLATQSYALDKFANRYLGDLFSIGQTNVVEESLTSYICKHKLCKDYDGGKKPEWTTEQLASVEANAQKLLA